MYSRWSAFRFGQGFGNRHWRFTQAPTFSCLSQAGRRKLAVGPPTSWM